MPSDKLKVLIAEDNPGLARMLTFKFESCGFDPIMSTPATGRPSAGVLFAGLTGAEA